MAKGQFLTPHQKGIVRRYYEHKDDLMHQKLSEIVSELYVCTDARKADRLWKGAQTALLNMGVHRGKVERLMEERDAERLARLVSGLF